MFIVYLTIYVLAGCGVAIYIHQDSEFRPIDTTSFVISSIFLWPFIFPIWLVIRPPSQLKDMTFEQSHAHFKQWVKTHKTRDLGDISFTDKKKDEDADEEGAGRDEDFSRTTSADKPYIVKGMKKKIKDILPEGLPDDDYGWDNDLDRTPTYEIGGSNPRKVYNPFTNDVKSVNKTANELTADNGQDIQEQDKTRKSGVPSISDILDNSHLKSRSRQESGEPFRDPNVRKLIDDGRLRDAYRVSRRMLKVAQELGEEDRAVAYRRYLREIENRLKAEKEKTNT